MTTYSVRCRNSACRHRRVTNTHPDEYQVVPPCPCCNKQAGWRIENRAYNKLNLCRCDGPLNLRTARPFPHKTTHPLCDHHPLGFYHQAKRAGIADEDIPEEFRPASVNAALRIAA